MSKLVLALYRFALLLKKAHIPLIPKIICKLFIRLPFGCQIGLGARFGKGTVLAYGGLGVVIHENAVIGSGVYIGSGVTIGSTNRDPRCATIGDNCLISSGAQLMGPISIGEGSVVGANAVVVSDIPARSVAVGVPAKVIKTGIDIAEYR